MYRFKCVTIIFYRVNDVPIKQQGLENYAANRVSSSTDDHLSYFFDGITQVIDEFGDFRETKFKAQICLHGGCLTFRFTSDPSTCDSFLECEGK
ncbi:hypothetical protein AAVH_38017 [Aphelenchoides avenae]|nr:hypothetical protein AAVH_38017 [Aphelenchus avenae]